MAGVNLTLEGSLLVTRGNDCPPGSTDAGLSFLLGLKDVNKSFPSGSEISQKSMSIDSPGSFVSLGLPSSLRARLFYLRVRQGSLQVRLTHAGIGVVTHPATNGTFLVEVPDTEQISVVEVQGTSSDFEWVAAGALV